MSCNYKKERYMNTFSKAEQSNALTTLDSIIRRCESALPKFSAGTSQHSLLVNRIDAMHIAKSLIIGEASDYSANDLEKALPPIISVISKCEKARSKYDESSTGYKRYESIISAMNVSKVYIEKALEK